MGGWELAWVASCCLGGLAGWVVVWLVYILSVMTVVLSFGWMVGWMGGLAALGVCQSFGLSNGLRQWCLWVA